MEEDIIIKKKGISKKRQKLILFLLLAGVILLTMGTTFAFLNYTRTGENNVMETSTVTFNYVDVSQISLSNQSPITEDDLTNSNKLSFTITGHNTLTNGVGFNIYAVYGDDEVGKTRLDDSSIKFKFVTPANGDGFSTISNNCATAGSLTFTNGQALLATGLVKGTTSSTTKEYELYMWVDSDVIFVSSTTKRANNAEGNPSLADATSGNVTASRYMRNTNEASTVTLYPADEESTGKIIYTTNEYSNTFYSIKIKVEAVDVPNS